MYQHRNIVIKKIQMEMKNSNKKEENSKQMLLFH